MSATTTTTTTTTTTVGYPADTVTNQTRVVAAVNASRLRFPARRLPLSDSANKSGNNNNATAATHNSNSSNNNSESTFWAMREFWFPPRQCCPEITTHGNNNNDDGDISSKRDNQANNHTPPPPSPQTASSTTTTPTTISRNLLTLAPKETFILPTHLYGDCERSTESRLVQDLKRAAWEQGRVELTVQERTGQTDRRKKTLRLRLRCANHTARRGNCPFSFTVFWDTQERHWFYRPPPQPRKLTHGSQCCSSDADNLHLFVPAPATTNELCATAASPSCASKEQPTKCKMGSTSGEAAVSCAVAAASCQKAPPSSAAAASAAPASRKRPPSRSNSSSKMETKKKFSSTDDEDAHRITLHTAVAAAAAKLPVAETMTQEMARETTAGSDDSPFADDWSMQLLLQQDDDLDGSMHDDNNKNTHDDMADDDLSLPSVTMQEAADAVLSAFGPPGTTTEDDATQMPQGETASASASTLSSPALSPCSSWLHLDQSLSSSNHSEPSLPQQRPLTPPPPLPAMAWDDLDFAAPSA